VVVAGVVRLLPAVAAVAGGAVGDRDLAQGHDVIVAVEEAGMVTDADDVDTRSLGAGGDRVVDGAGRTRAAHRKGGAELSVAERGGGVGAAVGDARRATNNQSSSRCRAASREAACCALPALVMSLCRRRRRARRATAATSRPGRRHVQPDGERAALRVVRQ
jgi:hypothetical protein